MDIESKIWNYSSTGTKVHAFIDGVAICRSSIRRPDAARTALDYCEAKGPRVCAACDVKFNAAIERAEASMQPSTGEGDYLPPAQATPVACCDHAPMYHGARGCDECGCATPRSAAPACICPRMEPPAKYGHHIVCPLRANDTDSKETNDVSIKEGPLTERQKRIITYLREGKRHEEIVPLLEEGNTVNVVKQECQNIRAKFRTNTVTQAVSLWATAQAYRETATLIESHRPNNPEGETDVHVYHVLNGLALILRERADRLTPQ